MAINDSLPNVTEIPNFIGVIDQRWLIEPLGGSQDPRNYLDTFPDEIYQKGLESHLVRLIYALVGPAGAGALQKSALDARLLFEDYGLDLFDLDRFYGDPFTFGRILEEIPEEDPRGVLPKDQWDRIRAQNARYRNRALDFVNGARLGNTPEGMRLVSRSGLGHDVEIMENYKYLFSNHSDSPITLPRYGHTTSSEEMIVLPRRDISRSEIQTIQITGIPTGGNFTLVFNGQATTQIAYNALDSTVESALAALSNIGTDQVNVTGGPGPDNPWQVQFTGKLSNRDVPQLTALNSLTGGSMPTIAITTTVGGVESMDEVVNIPPRDVYYLVSALGQIKPMTTIPTLADSSGLRSRQVWGSVLATSEYHEVIRYVTGTRAVVWPNPDALSWVEPDREKEGRRVVGDLQHHYIGFHNVANVSAYTEAALADPNYEVTSTVLATYPSEHVGQFSGDMISAIPALAGEGDTQLRYTADRILADYPEPLITTAVSTGSDLTTDMQMINGIYPMSYLDLPGVPQVKYRDDQIWASKMGLTNDYIEVDLGSVQAVNYLVFEVMKTPLKIEIAYDILDQAPRRKFKTVTPELISPYNDTILYTSTDATNPWTAVEFSFTGQTRSLIFTRFIRIKFARQFVALSPFLSDGTVQHPWNVIVRNLRIGRLVVNDLT